ncbi:MAG: A/G-specific adenine glycosylase [Planctomycetaceae bacterium]
MNSELPGIDANWLRRFRAALRRWHAKHGRDLPWRNCRDPYTVWISEIMLQQTTVAAVKPYFERFLQRFPNVAALAAADEADVLRLWEGLGYYSRARNLRKGAQAIVANGGEFPQSVDELLPLPGIGRYTAGAIVSFAFDRPAPIVEANTLRLYSRLLGLRDDPRSTAGQRLLWSFAEKLIATKSPAEFNQALMDLGATLCTANDPRCDECPVASCCRALAEQAQAEIPVPPRRPQITETREAYVAIESSGRYLIYRRPEGQRWAGLWDFPRFEVPLTKVRTLLERRIADEFGPCVTISERLAQFKHSVTRYRITLDCWLAKTAGSDDLTTKLPTAWVAPSEFASYPFSTTGRQLAELLNRATVAMTVAILPPEA